MLLAFYECWCADYQKWSNHLIGAGKLLEEINFKDMTDHIKRTRHQGNHPKYVDEVDEVDEAVVGMLMRKAPYDAYRHVVDDSNPGDESLLCSEEDLEIYEMQRDLFWWYCK
jgi:hypothetical protein